MSELIGFEVDSVIENGAKTASDMLTDRRLCAVMVVGVYPNGRDYKMWQAGDDAVLDRLRRALLDATPLKPGAV